MTQSVADLNDKSNKDQSLIDELQLQIHYLMKPNPLNVSAQQIDELAQTLCGSSSSLQNSITRALAMKNAQENQNPFIPPIYEESKIDKIFEEFYILGVKENRKVKAGSIDAEILYQYPIINIRSSSAQARALGNFSFPSGISARFLGLNDSASDVHEVLRPHQKREGNSFVFTLKSSGKEDKFPFNNIANREKELLYCCCVIIEDLSTDQNAENSHIILPKCYCIVSYCPTFELHFEILFKLLSIKQIQRLSNISEKERSPYNRGSIESVFQIQNLISDEEIGLLQDYYNSSHFSPNANINIGLLSIDDFKYTVPADLTVLDSSWFCPLLFSLLDFKDFFWILSALMHEKSVVFVSKNLDHVSSCVLGFHALLRPFN